MAVFMRLLAALFLVLALSLSVNSCGNHGGSGSSGSSTWDTMVWDSDTWG